MDLDVNGAAGVRLRASREPGAGPTVLLLHGLTSQRRTWEPVMARLMDVDLLTVDQRGHGESEAPDDGYDPATCAADAAFVLDTLAGREGPVVVVGHSWGASVAAELAASRPDLTAALVLIDGGIISMASTGPRAEVRARLEPPPIAMPITELDAMIGSGSLGPWWSAEVRDAVLAGFRVGPDGLARRRLAYEHHMQIIDGLLEQDVEATLKAVEAPTWVASCEAVPGHEMDPRFHDPSHSAIREQALDRAGELLADPRILRLAGAIHDVHLQWPALVAGLVRCAHDEAARARVAEGAE